MHSRSARSWTMIAIALFLLTCVVFGVLTLFAAPGELARVKLPGTNLSLVLYEDEKGLHRYHVLASGKKVARHVMLGSRGALAARPQVSVLGDQVIITFRTTENTAPYVEIDPVTCRIVGHSNQASTAPIIKNCQRR